MNVTTNEVGRCEVALTIEVDPAQEQDILKKAAKRIAREVNIPGFRKGKAPFNTVVRRFGWEVVREEAADQSMAKLIEKGLDEAEVTPYAQIQLDEMQWDPLVIKLRVPTAPVVELGDYRQYRLDYEPVEVTEGDVLELLEEMQEQYAIWEPVDRPSDIEDMVSMSVVEKDGETVLAENEAVEYILDDPADLPEDYDGPDMTTPLLGLEAGESKTFTLTYPEDFHNEDYAGKDITFEVTVSAVKEKELEPLDDDFAPLVSDFETLEELKDDLRQRLTEQRQREKDSELGQQMLDKIIEEAEEIAWPQALEDENVEMELVNYEQRVKQQSRLPLETFLQMQGKTLAQLQAEIREEVQDQLERSLVITTVARQEDLKVNESEVLERAKDVSDSIGAGDAFWQSLINSPEQREYLASNIMFDKTMSRLAAIARGEEPWQETEDTTGPADESAAAAAPADPDAASATEEAPVAEADEVTENT